MEKIISDENFRNGNITTTYIHDHPELLNYTDLAPEKERLAKLVAEISARGYNPYVSLGTYRNRNTPSLGSFKAILPEITQKAKRTPSPYPRGDRRALLDFVRDSGKIHFTVITDSRLSPVQ